MIAQIYPLKRMPRAIRFFDYQIPETMGTVVRGQLVTIPFRQSVLYGIVANVHDKPLRGIQMKSLLSVDSRITFREEELSFYESLAQELAQSVSSLLYSCFPTIPKRVSKKSSLIKQKKSLTIAESDSGELIRVAKQLGERHHAFAFQSDIKRMAATISMYLREKPNQKCVVLVPTVMDAERLHAYLHPFSPILLTATQNQHEQFFAWTTFRAAETGMIIGTKNTLYCTDPKTTSLFLIRSSNKYHGHHEQNPRFDARVIAERFEQSLHTNLFYFDVLPRVDDLHTFSDANILGTTQHTSTHLVDMEQEFLASPIGGFVSLAVSSAIQEALEKGLRVLCVLNKKTRINRLRCVTCKTQALCPNCQSVFITDEISMRCVRCNHTEARTNLCTKCQTKTLEESAFGNKKIAEVLQKEFPHTQFCSVDKEHPSIDPNAQIVLATSYYLEEPFNPFQSDRWGAVVLLDADGPLYRPSYRAVEEACYELEQWNAVAISSRAPLFVQTHTVSLFQEYIDHPITFLKKELTLRETYEQPPYRHIAIVQFSETEVRRAEVRQTALIKEIRQRLSDVHIQKIPSQKPGVHALEIRFSEPEKPILLELFATFPDDILIDTEADSR